MTTRKDIFFWEQATRRAQELGFTIVTDTSESGFTSAVRTRPTPRAMFSRGSARLTRSWPTWKAGATAGST